jgi:hypothetical protein
VGRKEDEGEKGEKEEKRRKGGQEGGRRCQEMAGQEGSGKWEMARSELFDKERNGLSGHRNA